MPLFHFSESHIDKRPRSIIYLQNNGKWNGEQYSSSILSCQSHHNELEGVLNQINHHLYQHYREYPIRWHSVMTNEILNIDSPTNGNKLGNFIRQNCFVIDDVFFQGGNIFGGKRGTKFVEVPELSENHLPIKITKESPVLTNICTFKDGVHNCYLQQYKASVEGIRGLQHSIVKMLLLREKQSWKESPFVKKDIILQELNKITKQHSEYLEE